MLKSKKLDKTHFLLKLFFVITLLISTRLFSFKGVDIKIFQIIEIINILILVLLCVFNKKRTRGQFKNNFIWIALFTLTAALPAYYYHNQSLFWSLFVSRPILYLLLYRFLHIYNFTPKFVLKTLFYIGVTWAVIMVVQAFTFPNYLFGHKDLEIKELLDRARGNLVRLNIKDMRFGVLVFLFSIVSFINSKRNVKRLFLVFLMSCGVFLTGTRQIIFTCFALSFIIYLYSNPIKLQRRFIALIITTPIIFFILYSSLNYYEYLIAKTSEDLNSNYARLLAAKFYLFDYWPSDNPFFAYLFGNGWEHGQSNYGKEIITNHWNKKGFFRVDIGLIGAFNKFGFLYIISVIAFLYKILKRQYTQNTIFIKYFFWFLAIISFTSANHFEIESIIIIACLAFVLDKAYVYKIRK